MGQIAGYPTLKLNYDKKGRPKDPNHRQALRDFVRDENLSDLLVLSHGWNNNETEAMAHYEELGASIARQSAAVPALAGRRLGLALVIWPSKAISGYDVSRAGQSGGAASALGMGDGDRAPPADPAALVEEAIDDLELDDAAAQAFREAAHAAIDDEDKFEAFLSEAAHAFANEPGAPPDETLEDEVDPVAEIPDDAERADTPVFGQHDKTKVFDALSHAGRMSGSAQAQEGGPQGAAGNTGRKAGNAVVGALNMLTFYKMKNRAGLVGNHGVAMSLAGLRLAAPNLRIHLSGHSFGARVLSMATLALQGTSQARPDTLCLIQAAFSHNSFSPTVPDPDGGFFRDVVGKPFVGGLTIVTHTHNDKAVLTAYSIASAAAGQNASNLSGPSIFGGLGANGTQHTPEATASQMNAPGQTYDFSGGKVFNLESSPFISGHADVRNDAVAFAICSAMGG